MGRRGKAIIVLAPSGAGKSTMMKRLRNEFPSIEWSVSYTTREKRLGEVDGEHYFFITRSEFEKKENGGYFIESFEIHGNKYGTSREFVEEKLSAGVNLFFDIDYQGADFMKNAFGDDAVTIFIAPPNLDALRERLSKRNTETPESIEVRMKNAALEMEKKDNYDHLIINNNLEDAYKKLRIIVSGC